MGGQVRLHSLEVLCCTSFKVFCCCCTSFKVFFCTSFHWRVAQIHRHITLEHTIEVACYLWEYCFCVFFVFNTASFLVAVNISLFFKQIWFGKESEIHLHTFLFIFMSHLRDNKQLYHLLTFSISTLQKRLLIQMGWLILKIRRRQSSRSSPQSTPSSSQTWM